MEVLELSVVKPTPMKLKVRSVSYRMPTWKAAMAHAAMMQNTNTYADTRRSTSQHIAEACLQPHAHERQRVAHKMRHGGRQQQPLHRHHRHIAQGIAAGGRACSRVRTSASG